MYYIGDYGYVVIGDKGYVLGSDGVALQITWVVDANCNVYKEHKVYWAFVTIGDGSRRRWRRSKNDGCRC